MKKLAKKKVLKRKRKNPEDYNLVYSDKRISELTPKQVIQHIRDVSEYPNPYPAYENKEDPFIHMDPEDILKYVNSFADRYLHLKN